MKNYGWRATKLADAYSLEELDALRRDVESDPASANPDHAQGRSIYLFTKQARKKLDALAWAVTYKLQAIREVRP